MSLKDSADTPGSQVDGAVQSSFRLPADLHTRLRDTLGSRNEKLTAVLHRSVEKYVEQADPALSARRSYYARSYLSELPGAAVIKNLSGHIIFGNREFVRLIGSENQNIVGKLPHDYVHNEHSAEMITALDETVRREGRPILCIEHMPIGENMQYRMAIRFPIAVGGEIELTGVIGFDLEDVKIATASLHPESADRRPRPFSRKQSPNSECPSHCLKHFLHAMPAIATIKDLDGRMLCINDEYTNVLGKNRSEVENLLSTEIWNRSFADLVTLHDELVRHSSQTFVTVESVPTRNGLKHRLNFRFPILNRENKLEMTGTLGFDYELMSRGINKLRDDDAPARAYLFLPPNHPDSLKLVYSAK